MSGRIYAIVLICCALSSYANATDVVEYSSTEKQTVMVELFTSQGCSSCPPAERWLNSYAQDEKLWSEIIPIAFHVDYWDKLGWPDVFANKAYSARQYRHRQRVRSDTAQSRDCQTPTTSAALPLMHPDSRIARRSAIQERHRP